MVFSRFAIRSAAAVIWSRVSPWTQISMGAPGGPEFFYFEDEAEGEGVTPEYAQIILDSSMVVDESTNGSVYSALYQLGIRA